MASATKGPEEPQPFEPKAKLLLGRPVFDCYYRWENQPMEWRAGAVVPFRLKTLMAALSNPGIDRPRKGIDIL